MTCLTWTRAPSSIRQHTSAYVSICQHTSAYVSIRQHVSHYYEVLPNVYTRFASFRVDVYVSIRQHTSAYVICRPATRLQPTRIRWHASAYVSIRQHTWSRALYTLPVQPLACNPHPHFQTHTNTTFSCSIPSTTPSTHSCAIVEKKRRRGGK